MQSERERPRLAFQSHDNMMVVMMMCSDDVDSYDHILSGTATFIDVKMMMVVVARLKFGKITVSVIYARLKGALCTLGNLLIVTIRMVDHVL